MSAKKKVYVAGPYSKGDVEQNVKRAIEIGNGIAYLGMVPFIPHLTHYWDMRWPHSYQFWLNYDNEWLTVCDALYRFSGESSGADAEEGLARSLGIPIFYNMTDLEDWSKRG